MKPNEYNYERFTLLLDADDKDDVEIIKWLRKNKTKKNNYSVQIKKALRAAMDAAK